VRKLVVLALVAAVIGLAAAARADAASARTFVAVLTEDQEVPACAAASNAAGGLFIAHVVDQASGTVEFKLVANNLPGSPVAAHIHVAPTGVAGPVVQSLGVDSGAENGVVRAGTFTNPALLAAIAANPGNYYVNVHTDVCPPGVVRGQLGEHGPSTT
jgi:Cu/Zn superoxide dismutase